MASEKISAIPAKQRILRCAAELFYQKGLRAVGVDTIIAQAGVAKASFYRHFPSKDDLIVAFLEERHILWSNWLVDMVVQLSPHPAGRPLAIFDALEQRFVSSEFRGCAFTNSIAEVASPSHPAHIVSARHKARLTEIVADILLNAGFADTQQLACQFMILVDGAIVTALRESSPSAAAAAKQVAAVLLQHAVQAKPSCP